MEDEKLTMLQLHCSKYPDLFNKVSNVLYNDFGNLGNVPALLITWIISKYSFYYDTDGVHMFKISPADDIIVNKEV